jgi:membrane protein DedA with SNARE-associated domain
MNIANEIFNKANELLTMANELLSKRAADYAYQPGTVYTIVTFIMLASAFGFPLPEEATILSVGFLVYMAAHPADYPPPYPGAQGLNAYEAAIVCFAAVVFSDLVVYILGRKYGPRLMKWRFIQRLITPESLKRIEQWTARYGMWAAAVFRFTPGLRFPGFWTCGMAGLSPWRFLLADGGAALLSVPTQIILVAHYGENIFGFLKQMKVVIFSVLAFAAFLYFLRRFLRTRKKNKSK